MDGYELVLKFVDQSPSFSNGFICGQIFSDFARGDFSDRTIRAEVFDQVVDMAISFGKRTCILVGHYGNFTVKFEPMLELVHSVTIHTEDE